MPEYRLETPISESTARKLKVGDVVYVSGTMITARDLAYARAIEQAKRGVKLPVDFEGSAIFHCGPLAKYVGGKWEILSAGPTTSSRLEHLSYDFMKLLKPRLVIGKGGMGESTLKALREVGAAYGVYTGGAGALAASAIKEIEGVVWDDLGLPEAVWILRVKDFGPVLITMDSHGGDLHAATRKKALGKLSRILP